MKGGSWLLVIVVGAIAAAAGVQFGHWSRDSASPPLTIPATRDAVDQLLEMPLMSLNQKTQTLSAWKGKVLVINFWATWCPPCREEMPEFSLVQDKYGPDGVQFVGIAIDSEANVADFSLKVPIAYPLLIAPANMPELIARLGNQAQALPFTVVIGRDGKLVSSHLGQLSKGDLAERLAPLL